VSPPANPIARHAAFHRHAPFDETASPCPSPLDHLTRLRALMLTGAGGLP